MPVSLYFPTKAAPSQTITLRAGMAQITRKERRPIGRTTEFAASGRDYVRKISANIEELWPIDVFYLPTNDIPPTYQGKSALVSFIENTLDFNMQTCEIEDPEGFTIVARYLRGLETLREGGGVGETESTKDQWFGTLTFRKTI